jgi:uncharacterized membrane protein YdbT with pleckstrin-like domain
MFNFLKSTSYTFEGKKEQESVVLFLHRHWYTLVSKISVLLIMSLFPILVLLVLGQIILENNLIPLFTFLWASYIMAIWFYLFYTLTMYTLDYWIITNERVVNNIQHGFFNRRISEVSIHMVQDVSVKLIGMIPTMLNFGLVEIQTAAEIGHFKLEQIPKPQVVKDKIMEIVEKTEDEQGQRMYGLTRRHKFSPEKYNEAESTRAINDTPSILNEEDTRETNIERQIEENEHKVKENNVPPNLPI